MIKFTKKVSKNINILLNGAYADKICSKCTFIARMYLSFLNFEYPQSYTRFSNIRKKRVFLQATVCNHCFLFRIPFLELGFIMPNFARLEKPDFDKTEKSEENVKIFMSHSLDYVLSIKRPRIIKTHLPLELLPIKLLDTCKV